MLPPCAVCWEQLTYIRQLSVSAVCTAVFEGAPFNYIAVYGSRIRRHVKQKPNDIADYPHMLPTIYILQWLILCSLYAFIYVACPTTGLEEQKTEMF